MSLVHPTSHPIGKATGCNDDHSPATSSDVKNGVKPVLLHIMPSRVYRNRFIIYNRKHYIQGNPVGGTLCAAQHYCLSRQLQMSKGKGKMVLLLIMQATAGMEVQFHLFLRTVLLSFSLSSSSRRILKLVAFQCQCPATQRHIQKGSSPQQHCCENLIACIQVSYAVYGLYCLVLVQQLL